MLYRKSVVAAVAALSLGFGTACTIVHAQETPQDKQTQDKNPSSPNDKQTTKDPTNAPASDTDLQAKMQEQEKMKADFMANYNDADFVKIASMSNADEIEAARQALTITHNDDVKMFAQHMIDDHTTAGTELKSLAQSKGWTLADDPDAKHKMLMKSMTTMEPADFDKAYASGAVKDHEEAVALFKFAADKTSDDQLKAFINKELPTFQDHLKMAQDLESKLSAMGMTK